jgi:hypothetical protein
MSRFEREWAIVPKRARWIAVLMTLVLMVVAAIVPHVEPGPKPPLVVLAFFLLSLLGVAAMAIYVLLLGYIYGDAGRRGMNRILWTLLAIFIPYAVGIILYFVLREPILVPCPSCGAPARKGHAYCARCGTAVRTVCPNCRQPVEAGWRNCTHCGRELNPPAGATPVPTTAE